LGISPADCEESQVLFKVVVELSISRVEEEDNHSGRALARCGELKGYGSIWISQRRIRLDPMRDRVVFVRHDLCNRE
jgi:hypothetical protein